MTPLPGPVPVRRALLGLRAGVLIALAVAAGGGLHAVDDHAEYQHRPFVVAGAMGETVHARTFELTVVSERGVSAVRSYGTSRDTGGVWVLVRVQVAGTDAPVRIGYAAVRDARGRLFQASGRVNQPVLAEAAQPGIPRDGELAFEVTPDAAEGLTLLVAQNALERRMDSQAEVVLPEISPGTVALWRRPVKDAVPLLGTP